MKTKYIALLFLAATAAIAVAFFQRSFRQNEKEPWAAEQLMAPADLAKILNSAEPKPPLIISVSPEGMYRLQPDKGIKGSVEYGAAEEPENLARLKTALDNLPKDTPIVLYCGCCPFNVCPNIRPAFQLLQDMGFSNHKLLDLRTNIMKDWIDHGYPMNE